VVDNIEVKYDEIRRKHRSYFELLFLDIEGAQDRKERKLNNNDPIISAKSNELNLVGQ
jgi:hypothetical protein